MKNAPLLTRLFRLSGSLLLLSGCLQTLSAADSFKGVVTGRFIGWPGSVVVDASDADMRAVVTPAAGGRIVYYSLDEESILHIAPGTGGLTLATNPKGFQGSGYQLDVGPEILGVPSHPELWNGAYESAITRDYTVTVTSRPDPVLGIQLSKEITIDPDTGELGIQQTMKNTSQQETSFCLWDRTLVRGGGFFIIPTSSRKSRFAKRWSLRRKIDGKFIYDGDKPESPNVRVIDGMVIGKATGAETKIGVDSDACWVAYTVNRLLYVKYFPYSPKAEYSDGGNSVEAYWNEQFGEMEPLSPEARLKPGESYSFPEKWTLIELDKSAVTFEDARQLVKKVPPSPFASKR